MLEDPELESEVARLRWPAEARTARELMPLVYPELKRMAHAAMARERQNHTLQPTALVHEAYLRLDKIADYVDTKHFTGMATLLMRRILVDWARRHRAEKNGGKLERVELTDEVVSSNDPALEILALDRALDKLAVSDALAAAVFVLRFFGRFSFADAGEALRLSEANAAELWRYARSWIRAEMFDPV